MDAETYGWDDPRSDPLGDVRREAVRQWGADMLRLNTFGPYRVWFRGMTVQEALERYGTGQ